MDFRTSGRMLVIRQNKRPPTDEDWAAFCAEITRLRPKLTEMRALVFTDGGGPTSDHRKKLSVAMAGAPAIQTAVISDRPMSRFIVATIGLFNKSIRSFLVKETPDAFLWLGLKKEDRKTVSDLLHTLETTVSDLSGSVEASV